MSYVAPVVPASGLTFSGLQSSGPSGHIEKFLTALAAANPTPNPTVAATISLTGGGQSIANPTVAVTVSANGGGRTLANPSVAATVAVGSATTGSLPAGTYYAGYTFSTPSGETTLGSSVSTVFTVTAGLTPTVTLPNLPTGATSANIYLSNTNGANTALVLYQRGITQATAATVVLNSALWNSGTFAAGTAPPVSNTTIGAIPPGTYYAAVTQAHGHGETTIGTSASTVFTVTANTAPASAATGSATTGTGTLGAGAYLFSYTYVDANGNETTAGTSEVSGAVTLASVGEITITFNDTAPGYVVTRNVYITAPSGLTGTETLYKTGVAVTAATYVANSASWTNGTTTQAAARAVPTTSTSAAVVPQLTLPALATGATGLKVYLSNTGGVNTAFALYATGVTTTAYNANVAPWNGTTFAAGTAPPTANTTIGALAPGAYFLNFTETNGLGETLLSTESATFTVTSQTVPSGVVTGSATTGTGTLAAGAYFASYSYVDSNGNETTVGTSEVASAVTLSATGEITWTFNDTFPGWAATRNIYLTAPGGASGSETLYATGIAGTAATYISSVNLWANNTAAQSAARVIPAANSTSVDVPRVTFPALQAGNTARTVYVTKPGGATTTEIGYARGITGLTFDLTTAVPTNSTGYLPPTANGTLISRKKYEMLRAAKAGNLQDSYNYLRDILRGFNSGDPDSFDMVLAKFKDAHLLFLTLATLCQETGVLLDSNPGTISSKVTQTGARALQRTWP